jgi:hypothetical protein
MPKPLLLFRRKGWLALALLAAAVAIGPLRAGAAEPIVGIFDRGQDAAGAPEPADEIIAAAAYRMQATPPLLRVDAAGRTARAGHTSGVLLPHMRTDAPADGIYEMTLYTFPSRAAAQASDRIEVLNFWKTFPPDLKGVRIYGARNCVEVVLKKSDAGLATGRCATAPQ